MRSALALLALSLALVACGGEPVVMYADPIDDYDDTPPYTPGGEAALDVGVVESQLYDPLQSGDALAVIHGFQGGTWAHVAVRQTGLAHEIELECALTTEAGERLGRVVATERMQLAPDGWLELPLVPLPVQHAPPNEDAPIDDLYGQRATLSVALVDDAGRTLEGARDVELVEQ